MIIETQYWIGVDDQLPRYRHLIQYKMYSRKSNRYILVTRWTRSYLQKEAK